MIDELTYTAKTSKTNPLVTVAVLALIITILWVVGTNVSANPFQPCYWPLCGGK